MLMILDLDNFKLVNDIYGHSMGDKVLRTFADVVRRNIRSQDVMVRIGGDEFMGFFANMDSETALESLHRRLNSELIKETVKLAGESFNIPLSISIGAILVPEYGRDYDMLFPLADSALYRVKQSGKNGVRIYGQDGENNLSGENDIQKEFAALRRLGRGGIGAMGGFPWTSSSSPLSIIFFGSSTSDMGERSSNFCSSCPRKIRLRNFRTA